MCTIHTNKIEIEKKRKKHTHALTGRNRKIYLCKFSRTKPQYWIEINGKKRTYINVYTPMLPIAGNWNEEWNEQKQNEAKINKNQRNKKEEWERARREEKKKSP